MQLAASFFSPAERDALASLPPGLRREGFFACWSRKEAYIKATGAGVSAGLDHFDVSLAPGEAARLLADRAAGSAVERWMLRDLSPAPGYSGALAVQGTPTRVIRFAASLQLA
jgi:4'-phosphopantetheinyl transferase